MDKSIYTPTELLKIINDLNIEHDIVKKEMLGKLKEIELKEKEFNNLNEKLNNIEKNYLDYLTELNNRKK